VVPGSDWSAVNEEQLEPTGPADERLSRLIAAARSNPGPDHAALVLARGGRPLPRGADAMRYVIVVIALTELVLHVPLLFAGEHNGTPIHTARHLAIVTIAVAVGFLYAAWKPSQASAVLPIAGTMAAMFGVTAVVDLVHGNTKTLTEASHVLDLVMVVLVWMLAGRPVPHRPTLTHRSHSLTH
jgi:hypothetical protein